MEGKKQKQFWNLLLEKAVKAMSRLPFWMLYGISDLSFFVVFYIARYRRTVVRENIDSSFPEKTEKERRRIERRFYHFFCDYGVETMKLLSISPQNIKRRMTFEGVDLVEEQLRTHPMAFGMLGHFGNWEWISTLSLHTHQPNHCAQLYRPLSDEAFDHLFFHLRSRFGSENISKYNSLRRIVELKREGVPTVVGFISDQSPRPQSIHDWVDFLHHKTPVFTGAERIGKKMNAAFFYMRVTRPRRGYYHCCFELMTADARQVPDYQLTEEYMRRLNESIQHEPHLWLWSHKRWKHEHLFEEQQRSATNETN